MKRLSRFSLLALGVALVSVVMSSGTAMAESDDGTAAALLSGVVLLVVLVIGAAIYVYMALALQTIATKTNTVNAWLAWIPIANLILMLTVAKKPLWWLLLLLIPIVGLVVGIMVWMAIAEARGKPNWWGILMLVPVANFVVPGYLAWSD